MHVRRDLREVAGPALLEQQRQEVDLEQDVAELVEQLGVVAALRGVGQLVGLLDRVRDDRALVLLAVPRALDAQPARDRVESRERRRRSPPDAPGSSTQARTCGGAGRGAVFGAL